MVGKVNYHFYMTIRSMYDNEEATSDAIKNTIKDLDKQYPLKFKLRYDWEHRNAKGV